MVLKNRLGTTEMLTKEEEIIRSYGAKLSELTINEKRKLGLRYGVKVDEVLGGRFQKAGIPKGFIIVKLNNVYVDDIAKFERLIQQFNPGDGALIQVLKPMEKQTITPLNGKTRKNMLKV